MEGFPVSFRENNCWNYAHLPTGANNADSNFSSIGNQNFFKHFSYVAFFTAADLSIPLGRHLFGS